MQKTTKKNKENRTGFIVPQLKEKVNHPSHYNVGKIETIDFLEDQNFGFHLGNAIKYICRAAYKGSETEDINKAIWCLNRYIEFRNKQ